MTPPKYLKVHVFCPTNAADVVRLAIGDAGGGQLGKYSHCAFVSAGSGYFLPLEGAEPAIGAVGEISEVQEVKIEFVCMEEKLKGVIKAINAVHPYEKVPIEVHALINID